MGIEIHRTHATGDGSFIKYSTHTKRIKPSNMKEEIKKKIEEEALRRFPVNGIDYPKQLAQIQGYEKGYMDAMNEYHNTTCSCCHTKFNGQLFCIDCFEKGYSLAQQSVNSDVLEAVRIMPMYLSKIEDREHRAIIIKAMNICEDSASQNQQNEKSAPSQVVEEAMKVTQKEVRVPNVVRTGEVVLSQQNEKSIDWNKLREEFFNECTDSCYINNEEVHREVCLSAEETFDWFKNKIEK